MYQVATTDPEADIERELDEIDADPKAHARGRHRAAEDAGAGAAGLAITNDGARRRSWRSSPSSGPSRSRWRSRGRGDSNPTRRPG
jgi:hypothetical protein